MRRKITALMMAAAVACTSLIACGTAKTAYADETIYGEVTATTDNGFTITVGTYEDGELALGDETADIVVADDTTYSMSMSGGQQPGEAPGEAPSGEAPEKSEGEAPSGEAPEKPEGEAPSGEAPSGEAPEQPEGEAPADMGNPMEVSLSSISVGAQVAVTFDADGNVESVEILGGMQSAMGMPGATSAADIVYTALYEYSEDATVDGETIASTGTDESAILVTDGEVTVSDSSITRESDDSTGGDNSSFYGVGATLLTTGGTLTVENCEISSDAAGGGTVYATNNTVTTNGASSAAGNGGDGYANLTIDSSSKWIVTGDSVLTTLANNGTIVDANGNTVSIVGTDGTVYVQGTSSYTITVDSYIS